MKLPWFFQAWSSSSIFSSCGLPRWDFFSQGPDDQLCTLHRAEFCLRHNGGSESASHPLSPISSARRSCSMMTPWSIVVIDSTCRGKFVALEVLRMRNRGSCTSLRAPYKCGPSDGTGKKECTTLRQSLTVCYLSGMARPLAEERVRKWLRQDFQNAQVGWHFVFQISSSSVWGRRAAAVNGRGGASRLGLSDNLSPAGGV